VFLKLFVRGLRQGTTEMYRATVQTVIY